MFIIWIVYISVVNMYMHHVRADTHRGQSLGFTGAGVLVMIPHCGCWELNSGCP